VTNSHEPSYYEIALTNRQVVVAFVILLLCLVSAFFSGLWIGRESAARVQDQIVRNTPPAPVEPQEGQALDEFRFFEDGQRAGGPGSVSGQPQAEASPTPTPEKTTLLEDLGGAKDEPAPEKPEKPVAPVKPAPSPTPARPQPNAPSVPNAPNAPNTTEPRIATGQLVIQVFSTADADQAESVRTRLTKGGQKAFLSPVKVGGRTMYRVRIGPFDSRDRAQKVAEQVRKTYKLDTWVTE